MCPGTLYTKPPPAYKTQQVVGGATDEAPVATDWQDQSLPEDPHSGSAWGGSALNCGECLTKQPDAHR